MSDDARLDDLIARHLDGRAGAADLAELDAALRASPEAARRFAAQARIDGDLRTAHRAAGESADTAGSITQRLATAERHAARRSARRFRPRPRRTHWLLPLAAGLVVAVGILAWLAGSADAHKADAPFTVAGRAVPAGAALAGTVEISGGGSVILAAGSRAVADGTAAEPVLRLEHGSADCTVASRSSGRFAVATPHGGMSVIGTAFTVAVGEDTRLSVREGTVEATAGGERLAVGPGGIARLGDAGPPRLYRPLLRTIRVATAEGWNNNGPGTSVTVVGPGPTGYPSVRLDFAAGSWPWASCIWRPGVDWRDADGISLVLTGTGSGRRLELELMDDGPEAMAGERDGYERFVVGFVDDAIGWHERRFPFTGFARRADLWPGMPNDGFGRERVHGLSLIGPESSARASLQIERIGLYRTR